ncbi:MAG: recombinase zinc beta ribbon domain-containing protein [Candidatus Pacebacteria bacterium]|nr:recombinase zinc beta ribbon domain-containing protein [Candidatus Paceibacterota bacterium]MBP9867189.1 recombinase zinc beta ribbon domain-containing protein [Candidatus Paceibacterota bacterium]
MITMDDFDKVQIMLGRNGKPRPKQHFFTYTGLMKCGECGCAITACEKTKIIKTTGQLKKYTFYYCTRRKAGTENCTQKKVITLEELESQISTELEKVTISDTFKEMALEAIQEDYAVIAREEQAIYDSQLRELSTLETELRNIFQMRIGGRIDDEKYAEETNIREDKIVRLKALIEDKEESARRTMKEIGDKFTHATRLKEKFEKGTLEDKKGIFISLGGNCTLKDKKLSINKHHWVTSIEKYKDVIDVHISPYEPVTPSVQIEKEAYAPSSIFLRGRWDLNPRPLP